LPTACVDVMPTGLSSTTQPLIGLPFLRRPTLIFPLYVTSHSLAVEQAIDACRLVEALVFAEADLRRELEVHGPGDLAADILGIARERCNDRRDVVAAERHDVHRRELQVRRHAHFGNGDDGAR